MERMEGNELSRGLVKGVAVVLGYEVQRTIALPKPGVSESSLRTNSRVECERMDEALEESKRDLHALNVLAGGQPSIVSAIALVSAHAAMAGEIASLVKERIVNDLVGVEEALDSVISQTVSRLAKIDNDYLRERETDVRDVGRRMMRHLMGLTSTNFAELPPGTIIVARELVPSDAIALADSGVVGVVTQVGGRLGHTAIIARSLGIPAVSGISNVAQRITSGMTLLIDAEAGIVIAQPDEDEIADFDARVAQSKRLSEASVAMNTGPCRTSDGQEIVLYGNVGLPADLDQVLSLGLAGVGLFRTEFLYLQSKQRPNAEAQRHLYAQMSQRLGDRPLVIRTFDLGGEKLPPFLLHDERLDPSSLNLRGLRFSLVEKQLLREQLTAIVQVAQEADVRILLPMVIGGHDFAQAIAMIEEVVVESNSLKRPQIGAMVETPAALFCLDEILELANFITIGTNDLTQYLLAADRELSAGNEHVTAMHPAVIRAIDEVVMAAKRWDCPVCVCGEEAGEVEFAMLLIGLGIRELSVSPARVGELREAIAKLDTSYARDLADQARACRSPQEVRELFTFPRLSENNSRPRNQWSDSLRICP
ncbi:phosphoenolpyruvate--protein phosphotransferase [Neorhodopirellula pilleata]|uniref:Phosphoenolpyruvate-protein phosphotransferase n=1 Tax=Neorhodopirellula pilleata TaxID=2714738 RepID=A0A5C6AQ78_9BACT|nr:phosphoenolpyruvate--protein phosphotransferase [Neorhodopirellula pilleata]TWU01601.1 Phosphoenolpyruvate-protein phosphotransferase [Neorhodopirellula pilleata]